MSNPNPKTQVPKQTKPIKIEVPREKAEELYKFTDMYLYTKKFMTWVEFQKKVHRWAHDLIKIIHWNMCGEVFDLEEDEECPVERTTILEEIYEFLRDSKELSELVEEDDWIDTRVDDDHIHIGKVEVYPHLEMSEGGYRIYMLVYEPGVKGEEG